MKLKRKGAYEYEIDWHQNHSSLVVQKAVEAYLVKGVNLEDFITGHKDRFDFMIRLKVPRSSKLMHGEDHVQNVSRYYISDNGKPLVKIMPPLPSKMEAGERHFRQHIKDQKTGDQWGVTIVNTMPEKLPDAINYYWYINEARKLVNPLYDGYFNDMI